MLKLDIDRINGVLGTARIPVTELAEIGELHSQTIYDIVNFNTQSPKLETIGHLFDAINVALKVRDRDPIKAMDFLIEYQEG